MSILLKSPGAIQGKIAWLGRTVDGAMFASVKIPKFFPGSNHEYHWEYSSGYLAEGFLVVPVMAGEDALLYEIIHIRSGIIFSNSLRIRSLDQVGKYSGLTDRMLTIKFAFLLNKIEASLPQSPADCKSFGEKEFIALQAIAAPIFIAENNLYLGG
jgi:hypothetical protein